jgi:hypothetical protein
MADTRGSEAGRYRSIGPEAAAYERYGVREDDAGQVRVYERDSGAAGAWLASTLAFARADMR